MNKKSMDYKLRLLSVDELLDLRDLIPIELRKRRKENNLTSTYMRTKASRQAEIDKAKTP